MNRFLINSVRPLIFSTALAPPCVAGALEALEILIERPDLVDRLQANTAVLRNALADQGFDVSDSQTQILPVVVGDATVAVNVCEQALQDGVFAQAIRPPTVPEGTSRLRLTVMATHKPSELQAAAEKLSQ